MKRRLQLLARALLLFPLAAVGLLTLIDHGWTLWNEVRLSDAMDRAEARLVEIPADARQEQVEGIVVEELKRAHLAAHRADVETLVHDNDFALHVDVTVPWRGLFAAVPHRSELRRTLALQVDRS